MQQPLAYDRFLSRQLRRGQVFLPQLLVGHALGIILNADVLIVADSPQIVGQLMSQNVAIGNGVVAV